MDGGRRRTVAIATAAAIAAGSVTGYLVVHRERPQPNVYAPRPTRFYEVPATQRFRYPIAHRGKRWGRPYHLDNAIVALHHQMDPYQGKGYQLDDGDGDGWGARARSLVTSLHILRHAMARAHVGAVWRIRPVGHKVSVWKMKKVDIDPAVKADTEGTNAIDIIVGSTLKHFPAVGLGGIYVCRYIAGTSSLSQHAYGNAVDLMGSAGLLDSVARWQYGLARKGWLPLSQLLWRGHDWFSGASVYDHYNHIHDSGKPYLGGGCNRPGTYVRAPNVVPSAPFEGQEDPG